MAKYPKGSRTFLFSDSDLNFKAILLTIGKQIRKKGRKKSKERVNTVFVAVKRRVVQDTEAVLLTDQ